MDHEQATVISPPVPSPAPVKHAKSLAPGFRFHPTDEELVRYYLTRKVYGKPFRFQAVAEIDVYKSEPWELGGYSMLSSRDSQWYFFSPVDRKYGCGSRLNRATGRGYWKATGKDRSVTHKGQTIGMKKTLVFHSGRAPVGKRTDWVMHEYRLTDVELVKAGAAQGKDAFVLCRIFEKSGLGPPIGDRYAPFVEEEWDDDAALLVPGHEAEGDMANGDDANVGVNDFEKEDAYKVSFSPSETPICSMSLPLGCKEEPTDECTLNSEADPESFTIFEMKRSKHSDPSSSNAHGSEDSATTSHEPPAPSTNFPSLEFPFLDSIGNRESHQPVDTLMFDASNLEKSVPPGYLKFINNLENEILNVSMERETLKIEVMRAQAMINVLHSRIEFLTKDNEDCRRIIQASSYAGAM